MTEALPGGPALRMVLMAARSEAERAGSRDVQAEHVLLALADQAASAAGTVLAAAGLDRPGVLAALQRERERSLAAIGMAPPERDRLGATRLPSTPGWGASTREALVAAHKAQRAALHTGQSGRRAGRDQRPERGGHADHRGTRGGHRSRGGADAIDLLIGVLAAELGTVPRALALAGIDRASLLESARQRRREA